MWARSTWRGMASRDGITDCVDAVDTPLNPAAPMLMAGADGRGVLGQAALLPVGNGSSCRLLAADMRAGAAVCDALSVRR